MTTPAYVDYDPTKPAGSSTPTVYSGDDLAQSNNLRDMVIAGRVAGFVQSRTQGTGPDVARPQYVTWYNSALGIGFRMKNTWTGTSNYKLTTVEWEWTNDSGGSWTPMGSAQVNTMDSDDNITASTNSGGFVTLVMEFWTKLTRVVAGLAAHIAGSGPSVHGLGSMSTQAASNVAITGGAVDATLGQTTPKVADVLRLREAVIDLGTISASGTATLNLSLGSHFYLTAPTSDASTFTIAVSNGTSGVSQTITLEIIDGLRDIDGRITWSSYFKWLGGSSTRPADNTLESSGRNIFVGTTRDGGATRIEMTHLGKGG